MVKRFGDQRLCVKNRLPKRFDHEEDKNIGPLQDAQEAIRLVRRNAQKWNLNPNKIGIMGFSAGGHLVTPFVHALQRQSI